MVDVPHSLNASETSRLAAVGRYLVLDTEPEPAFDELVKMAANACDTPIALLGIIDADRVWYKAKHGFDGAETPRPLSAAQYTMLKPGVTVVDDFSTDFRFSDNENVVSGARAKFYAGAPLETADGFRIGVLCVADTVSRSLSADQIKFLESLSRKAMVLLEERLHSLHIG